MCDCFPAVVNATRPSHIPAQALFVVKIVIYFLLYTFVIMALIAGKAMHF